MTTLVLATVLLTAAHGDVDSPRVAMVIAGRGQMVMELNPTKAPKTVARFLDLVKSGFYDGVAFHRVENQPRPFIVVTGDPLTKTLPIDDARIGTGGSGMKIPFEKNDLPFVNGAVGLSRDKKDPNSGDSQFFICNGNQRFLEGTYTCFGKVVSGLDVIARIQRGDRITSIRID